MRLTNEALARLAKQAAMDSIHGKRSGIFLLPWEKTDRIRRRMWIAVAAAIRAALASERRRFARTNKRGGGQ